MSLPSFSIRRPVSVIMFFVGILLFGFISITKLSQELFPPIVYPKLTVVTNYANAAPEEIENLITKPIEEAVGSTPGLRSVTSISREGISLVMAEFGWNQSMDFAALGVREKIDLIKARLPRDAEEPTVVKFNPFELPVVTISVASDKRSGVKLKHFATKWVKDEMEKINGVASANISGGADEEILVSVDQGRLKISDLGIVDIQKTISESNLNYPGGTIKENFYEYLVRTMGEFQHIDEIGKIAVGRDESRNPSKTQPGSPEEKEDRSNLVLLKDVADIERVTKKRTSFSRFNNSENLTISIHKQAQANTIRVAADIIKRLNELKLETPDDVKMDVIYNQATFIQEAINGVRDSAIQGGFLAFLILLIFLKSVRTSILIIVIIPITVLATFTLMFFSGISLNVISLGGVALGVGMLIDSAIVVIENVTRHADMSKSRDMKIHALRGTEEVIAPLVSSTLTTVMVFLPMIFVTGIAGQIFKELAWVVVVTQLFSILVSITLLPMLIVMFTPITPTAEEKEAKTHTRIYKILVLAGKPIDLIFAYYNNLLPKVLAKKGRYLFVVLLLFIGAMYLLGTYEKEVMPKVDQGQFITKINMPVGTRVEKTNQIVLILEKYFSKFEIVESVAIIVGSSKDSGSKSVVQQIGSHQGQMIVTLKKDRALSTNDFLQTVRNDLKHPAYRKVLGRAKISLISQESAFKVGGEDSTPIVVNVKGADLDILTQMALEIESNLKDIPGAVEVNNTIPESAPETKIYIDKDRAAFHRLSVTDLATASHISIKGSIASKFKEGGKEVDIRVVLREQDRGGLADIPHMIMHSSTGGVPLNEVVTLKSGQGPSEIKRESQERIIKVTSKVFGRSVTEVNTDLLAQFDKMDIAKEYSVSIAGESEEVQESFKSLQMALILSIVLVYMIMAAQFESYFQPFIIMFTLPLSMIGVAFALGITGTAISVVVVLGIILLGGIVVNNGIILIDFINGKVLEGASIREAVLQAGVVRFRPILMTALTTILGLAPLAMGLGEGSKLQSPMAIAVMGGLLVATFLTLLVIPAIYEGTMTLGQKLFKKHDNQTKHV